MSKYIFLFSIFSASLIFSQSGIIKSYYGPKKLRAKLSYVNDVYDGTSYWYYENGNLMAEKTYSQGKLNGWGREYFESGLLKEEYFIRNGIRDGHNRKYWENGALKELINYEDGLFLKSVEIDFDPLYVAPVDAYNVATSYAIKQDKEEYICDADICPTPIGGMNSIQEKVIYPEHAQKYGLEGTISLLATIRTDGFVESVKVIRGLGLGCDEAAENAVKQTRFLPGQTGGQKVSSNITIYVDFNIEKQKIVEKNKILLDRKLAILEPELSEYFENSAVASKSSMAEVLGTENLGDEDEEKSEQENLSIENPQDFIEEKSVDLIYTNLSCTVDVCPEPIGGMVAVMNNFSIPAVAKRLKLYGDIIIEADVDKYGNVRDTKILEDVGAGCGTAAEVAVLDTKFNAGRKNGELVRTKVIIVLPVRTLNSN